MTLSNAERQRRHRQRTKEKLARGGDPAPWEGPDLDFTIMTDDKIHDETKRRAMVLEPIRKWMDAPGDELMRRAHQQHQEHAAWRKEDTANLAQRVTQYMTEKGMKMKNLAKTLHVSPDLLNRLLDTGSFPNDFSYVKQDPIIEALKEWLASRPQPRRVT